MVPPARDGGGNDAVVADLTAMGHAGHEMIGAIERVVVPSLDRSLLRDDVIGHAGLAQALRDLAEQMSSDMQRLQTLVDATSTQVRHAELDYHTVDDATAGQFRGRGEGTI
jgi:hypothetical protein